jgi:tryptophan synthase alpha chain
LSAAFEARPAGSPPGLIPYITAGFPRCDSTPALMHAAERAGCLAVEVGIPFSDPLADGPTIQRSSQRALHNGMRASLALEQVALSRSAGLALPVAAMTYVNPVLAYGMERFCAHAAEAGLDGLIVPDLPDGEADELRAHAGRAGLALIPLVAPTTTPDRLQRACEHARGFIYCVSVTGTTGARAQIAPEAFALLDRLGKTTKLPRALGFGLSRHEHLLALRGRCEAAVVGAALIEAVDAAPNDAAAAVEHFCTSMLHGDAT